MIYHSVIPYEHILFQQAAPQDSSSRLREL